MDNRTRLAVFVSTVLLFAALGIPSTASAASPDGLWTDVAEIDIPRSGDRQIVPSLYRTVALDSVGLATVLQAAPMENSANAQVAQVILSLPLPDGGYANFNIQESPIMAPELAAKFPEIRTFLGQGIDDPTASLRFDVTPAGFHAMVRSPAGRIFIDPFSRGDTSHYISYNASNSLNPSAAEFRCGVTGEPLELGAAPAPLPEGGGTQPNGDTLKTYRLAVGATGEYTAFHSAGAPTVAEGLAAIVTAMVRVNGVYERDMAIRMVLVANNDQVVFTDPATDPYTNNSGGAMLGQNQTTLDNIIGSANYDIGHVFSTGGGGVASLRVPCVNGSKARGVTGLGVPTGDVFWIDFVAHEMGHQWGGNHTFNGTSGNCAGGNRNGSTAYEPGSGTTIQAYAGICGSQNIQSNSDDHFHTISYQEIVNYITTGNGNNCPVATPTGNTPPTVDAGASHTIPINTPFELCGTASDVNGDSLTYGWEQFNLGPAGAPNAPVGDAAIFRSFSPVASSCRTFPQFSDLLNNTQTLGEILPSYNRTLTFRMMVRDNRAGGGGVDYDSTDVVVSDVGGPFLVTSPNTAVTWSAFDTENVTWNVAGTNLAPISCSQVDILISTDGGLTYPFTALAATPNDGSADIVVPAGTETTEARLRVQCTGNIFFDISDVDFEIEDGTTIFIDGFESGDTTAW